MKMKLLGLAVAAATAFSVSPSFAAPITAGSQYNINGDVTGTGGAQISDSTGLNFTYPGLFDGAIDGVTSVTGTGTFATLACTSSGTQPCAFIKDIPTFSIYATTSNFITEALNGQNFSFTLNSPLTITRIPASGNQLSTLVVAGAGTLFDTGFDATPGIFTLTAQGGAAGTGGNVSTTYSASIAAQRVATVPEPASMALLGLGALGLLLARRKSAR